MKNAMTDAKLKSFIAEAAALDRQIKALTDDLKARKEILIQEARAREKEHRPTDGGGSVFELESLLKITFPAASLKAIPADDDRSAKIHDLAGKHFCALFEDLLLYKPVKAFRDLARALLGKKAEKLIELCEDESRPRVSFERE